MVLVTAFSLFFSLESFSFKGLSAIVLTKLISKLFVLNFQVTSSYELLISFKIIVDVQPIIAIYQTTCIVSFTSLSKQDIFVRTILVRTRMDVPTGVQVI
jgi:hypothetical protein